MINIMARQQTPGCKALRKWMEADPARTQASVAKAMGVTAPAVHHWVEGTSRPEHHLRGALRRLTGIPEEDWELPREREARERANEGVTTLVGDTP